MRSINDRGRWSRLSNKQV